MTRRARRRAGLAIIEVLVVLAIIAGLISLMIPAIRSAREAARRCACLNNLKQVGLALQNYEFSADVLPPGVVNARGPVGNRLDGLHTGWLVQLLPYMEQNYIYHAINTDLSVYAIENTTAGVTRISSLTCPSDAGTKALWGRPGSSYAGCHHDVEAPIAADNHGVFFLNSRVRHAGLTDGSSQTIFVGERKSQAWDTGGWMSGTRATLRNTGSPINAPVTADAGLVGGFSSHHLDGANFAFGDGSVRCLRARIDPEVYRRLGHRDDGEMIAEGEFQDSPPARPPRP